MVFGLKLTGALNIGTHFGENWSALIMTLAKFMI